MICAIICPICAIICPFKRTVLTSEVVYYCFFLLSQLKEILPSIDMGREDSYCFKHIVVSYKESMVQTSAETIIHSFIDTGL